MAVGDCPSVPIACVRACMGACAWRCRVPVMSRHACSTLAEAVAASCSLLLPPP